MNQLRIYTLADKDAAYAYFNKHWPKHLKSLPKYGITVAGIWSSNISEMQDQVFVLVSFPKNANVDQMMERYLGSPEFHYDMEGFDRTKIINIEVTLVNPARFFIPKAEERVDCL